MQIFAHYTDTNEAEQATLRHLLAELAAGKTHFCGDILKSAKTIVPWQYSRVKPGNGRCQSEMQKCISGKMHFMHFGRQFMCQNTITR